MPPPEGPLNSALPRSLDNSDDEGADSFLFETCAFDTEDPGLGQCGMARKGKKSFLMPCTWDTEEIPGERVPDSQQWPSDHCSLTSSLVNVSSILVP